LIGIFISSATAVFAPAKTKAKAINRAGHLYLLFDEAFILRNFFGEELQHHFALRLRDSQRNQLEHKGVSKGVVSTQ
jgi:hypothetical protein